MKKYRKKPVVIEAVQMAWENWSDICEFTGVGDAQSGKPWGTNKNKAGKPLPNGGPGLFIPTLEGLMLAEPGDWIIKGVEGELYPCKDSVFQKTYEEVV